MIQRLIVHGPISQLSIGQVTFNILRELYRRKIQVQWFPYGNPDLSAFKIDPQFGQWIERSVNSRYEKTDRKVPTLNIWHLADSLFKPSDRQYTLSFHETDSPQPAELNTVAQQDHTFFTSSWTVDNFKTYGAQNVSFVPLGLDEDFVPPTRRLVSDEETHWICVGKHETLRKMTDIKIAAWIRKYGGSHKHKLTLCINNPFYQKRQLPDGRIEGFDMNDVYNRLFSQFPNGKPHNVSILPPLKTNAEMLALYQSADVDISGISRAEGFNIPAHTATCLGKWSTVTNCSAHKDWATAENSILIEPSGMVKAVDNIFFREGSPFSSGNMYDFTLESIIAAFEEAEKRAKTSNPAGLALAKTHTYKNTVSVILDKIEQDSV